MGWILSPENICLKLCVCVCSVAQLCWAICFPVSSVGEESTCNAGDPGSIPGLGRSTGEGIGYPLQYSWTCGSTDKESACNVGDLGSIPGLGRSPGEEKGYPLQYSGLENTMDWRRPQGPKESDTTEWLSLSLSLGCNSMDCSPPETASSVHGFSRQEH